MSSLLLTYGCSFSRSVAFARVIIVPNTSCRQRIKESCAGQDTARASGEGGAALYSLALTAIVDLPQYRADRALDK